MVKALFILIAVLIGSVAFAILAHRYPGYVLIDVSDWTIEANLVLVGVIIVAAFFAFHYLLRTWAGLSHVPSGVRFWQNRRIGEKVDQSLMTGLIRLAECKWQEAESQLMRYAEKSKTPILNYLAAARAAQEQAAFDRRDKYLNLAHQSMPDAQVAVGLTQAELQLGQHHKEQALATLRHLQQLDPRNVKVLRTLARVYRDLSEWDNLIQLAMQLRKYRALPEDKIRSMEKSAYLELLAQAGTRSTPVQDTWYRVPTDLQSDEDVLICYLKQLILQKSSDLAEPLIRKALKKKWNEELLSMYGRIHSGDVQQQLNFCESLLDQHENDPVLLLTLGRLCVRNALWGKAKSYLEASVGVSPSADAFAELGRLLEGMGERDKALEYYRQGLLLIPGCNSTLVEGRLELEHKGAPKLLASK